MTTKLQTANDLTISVHGLYKKYNMIEYYKECCQLMINYAPREMQKKLQDALDGADTNPFLVHESIIDFIEQSKMPTELAEKFVEDTMRIQMKYPFLQYSKECAALRKAFFKERKNYFFNTMQFLSIIQKQPVSKEDEFFQIECFQDILLSKWIDETLKKISPKSLEITYEDLTGKIHTINVCHKEATFHDEYIEAPLINRKSGICIFDSLLLHSFHDSKKWIYVPIPLIINIKGEGISELNSKEPPSSQEEGGQSEV